STRATAPSGERSSSTSRSSSPSPVRSVATGSPWCRAKLSSHRGSRCRGTRTVAVVMAPTYGVGGPRTVGPRTVGPAQPWIGGKTTATVWQTLGRDFLRGGRDRVPARLLGKGDGTGGNR